MQLSPSQLVGHTVRQEKARLIGRGNNSCRESGDLKRLERAMKTHEFEFVTGIQLRHLSTREGEKIKCNDFK